VVGFVEPYTRPLGADTDAVIDLDNPLPGGSAQLPCVEALEFLADVYEAQDEREKAVSVRVLVRGIGLN
jgi:protein farnesyltransferase/geranylgeranyltransferase type-1 subunit alpha